ncbi:ATP-dependent helicase [Vibrio owensii]|uniref:ATP-dependent helicase n=1 Tax=Vibrio harveyi group TaxID=717610 RepID=UPI003CC53ED0
MINPELQAVLDRINAPLNPEQKLAAETLHGPVMVIASAGAGKTKTLIHRVASMIVSGISPKDIMVVTFTNKAASEIKERLEEMPEIGLNAQFICAGTFHSIILREIIKQFPESKFLNAIGIDVREMTNIDEKDASSLLKQAVELQPEADRDIISDNEWRTSYFEKEMSIHRAMGHDVKDYVYDSSAGSDKEEFKRITANVWQTYNRLCREANGIDFDDILLFADKMLRAEPEIAKQLSERFKYMMLDEYQDTNKVQQSIMDAIAMHHNNICTVGDEKQSIYGFRGADINVIMGFKTRYSNANLIGLSRNYRSYSAIIGFANACADAMSQRLNDGQMINEKQVEEPPQLAAQRKSNLATMVEFHSAKQEAEYIVKGIMRDLRLGIKGQDIAVLYRNKTLKSLVEKKLVENQVPYELVGDTSFYQKAEVKDMIALVRFMFHPYDSMAGLRMLNATKFGVSQKKAKEAMAKDGVNVYEFLMQKSQERMKSKRKGDADFELKAYAKKLQPFMGLCKEVKDAAYFGDNPQFIADVIAQVWDIYFKPSLELKSKRSTSADHQDQMDTRIQNVQFVLERLTDSLKKGMTIDEVIEDLVFMVEANPELDRNKDAKVKLMTLHASKGLEFENVYMIGVDELTMCGDEPSDDEVEESRRLTYVGITRAMKKLAISYAKSRSNFGEEVHVQGSRFLDEIESRLNVKRYRMPPPQEVTNYTSR